MDFLFSLFEADDGVTQPLDFLDDILMECEVHEYRCRVVDANIIGVHARLLRRQWFRRTRFTEYSRGMWARSLASVDIYYLLGADKPKAKLETFIACMSIQGILQVQPSYQRAFHTTTSII